MYRDGAHAGKHEGQKTRRTTNRSGLGRQLEKMGLSCIQILTLGTASWVPCCSAVDWFAFVTSFNALPEAPFRRALDIPLEI